jgi:hypothetical protein
VTPLDRWLPEPAVRTRHRRIARCGPAELWQGAATVRLADCGLLGRLIRARIPGLAPDLSFRDLFHEPPFLLLEEGDHYAISGLCGRIWSMRGEMASLGSPEEFLEWSERGTVRVLFSHESIAAPEGAALVSEVRVAPVDRSAALRLRAMGPFIGAFQSLVGGEALSAAVRAAERGR